MIDVVEFNLVQHLKGVRESLGNITEHFVHLIPCLEPLLFAVKHTCRIVKVL